jgi:hypothetical protein
MADPANPSATFNSLPTEIITIISDVLQKANKRKDALAFGMTTKNNLAAVLGAMYTILLWTLHVGETLAPNGWTTFV